MAEGIFWGVALVLLVEIGLIDLPKFQHQPIFLRDFYLKMLPLCTVNIQERIIMEHIWYDCVLCKYNKEINHAVILKLMQFYVSL